MRGGHLFHAGFNTSGISRILGKLIKIAQMPAATIDHKTQDLFEKLRYFKPLTALADRTEKFFYQWKDVDSMQVGDEQCQSSPAGQTIAALLYTTN